MGTRSISRLIGLALVLMLAGCTLPNATESTPASSVVQISEQTVIGWAADGDVTEEEYAHSATVGPMRLWWSNDAKFLYMAFEADTRGMVAIGLDPEDRMQGANYLIGFINGDQVQLFDAYGTAPTGNVHPLDTDLGGSNDIVAFAGVEENNTTRFEVQLPLDSGDTYDKPLHPGESYPIIAAVSDVDDFSTYHTARASGQITLDIVR